MGFMKPVAQAGGFGLAGLALSKDKKKAAPRPSMIQLTPQSPQAPTSMIGPTRGLY